MKHLVALLFALIPVLGWAQPLPALYNVAGVASNDRLNIRTAPDAGSDIVGTLAFNRTNVEVIRTDGTGRWGQVNHAEATGWVSMRYLRRLPGQTDRTLPRPAACFGTEPFWSLDLDPRNGRFHAMGETPQPLTDRGGAASSNLIGRFAVGLTGPAGSHYTAVIRRAACNDGMSDRAFGLDVDLLITGAGPARLYSGCCSLRPR